MNRLPYIFRLRDVVQASGAKIRVSERLIASARQSPEELFRELERRMNSWKSDDWRFSAAHEYP